MITYRLLDICQSKQIVHGWYCHLKGEYNLNHKLQHRGRTITSSSEFSAGNFDDDREELVRAIQSAVYFSGEKMLLLFCIFRLGVMK
jgi:hypothetical protein